MLTLTGEAYFTQPRMSSQLREETMSRHTTRAALENAASIATMILTTESLITELNPPKLPAPYDD